MRFDTPTRFSISLLALCALVALIIFTGASFQTAAIVVLGGLGLIFIALAPQCSGETETFDAPTPENADRRIVDALQDAVLLLQGSRVVQANAAARTLLGKHIVGQDVRTGLRHPAISTLLADPDGLGQVEVNGIGSAGQIWEIRVERAGNDQRLVHLVDRSARHAAERARVDFVANASHELRTPLATLLGYIETLQDDEGAGGQPETRRRFLSIMDAEAKRMQRLVSDLMSLSRIEAEKHAFPEFDVDLAELTRRVVSERPDKLEVEIDSGTHRIKGDAVQLSQLLHNLIDNAVKYAGSDESVRVTLTRKGENALVLSVIDRGEGIALQHLPRLTERFYRVDLGRSRSAGGTGLGLSIVKHITEHHRGILDIDSTLGLGTTVAVSFSVPPEATVT